MEFRHPAEKAGLKYLEERGHVLLAHNFHAGFAEIDLITRDESGVLHFVEVRAWQTDSLKHPLESLDARKRERMRRAAAVFLRSCNAKEGSDSVSFDLLLVNNDAVELHAGVF
jgi:putative endonuclease